MTQVKEFYIKQRSQIECNDNDYMNFYINLYNGKAHIYESLYSFEDKVDRDNVIVDKIFLDFDAKGNFFNDARTISKYLYQNDIRFCIRFSGRGFHIFVSLDDTELSNPSAAMRNYVQKLHEDNNTTSDFAVVGDLRRLRRVLHTINVKSHLYCIPLSYYDLQNKTYQEIKEMAKMDRGITDIYYGRTLLNISEFDKEIRQEADLSLRYGGKLEVDIKSNYKPPCIREFLSNPDLGYEGRRDVIIFLRDMGYFEEEVNSILEECLSPEKFHHCMEDEQQVARLFGRDDMIIMRGCAKLKSLGLCPDINCLGNYLYI